MDNNSLNTTQQVGSVGMPEVAPASHRARWLGIVVCLAVIGVGAWWMTGRDAGAPSPIPADGGVAVSAKSSATDVAVGQQFSVSIVADTGSYRVTAADVAVTYDAQHLRAVRVSPGELLPLELAGGAAENGRATMTVGSGTTPATGSGSVLELTFEAIAPGQAVITPVSGTRIAASGQAGNVVGALTPVTVTIR